MTIPEHSEEMVRTACAEMATCLNQLRDEPKDTAAEVVADAAIFEHYITNGFAMTFDCGPKLTRTVATREA